MQQQLLPSPPQDLGHSRHLLWPSCPRPRCRTALAPEPANEAQQSPSGHVPLLAKPGRVPLVLFRCECSPAESLRSCSVASEARQSPFSPPKRRVLSSTRACTRIASASSYWSPCRSLYARSRATPRGAAPPFRVDAAVAGPRPAGASSCTCVTRGRPEPVDLLEQRRDRLPLPWR